MCGSRQWIKTYGVVLKSSLVRWVGVWRDNSDDDDDDDDEYDEYDEYDDDDDDDDDDDVDVFDNDYNVVVKETTMVALWHISTHSNQPASHDDQPTSITWWSPTSS